MDKDLLSLEIGDLSSAGYDLALTGFTVDKLASLRIDESESDPPPASEPGGEESEEEDAEDRIPEAPREAVTRSGDLWRLGRHLLLCGDSTDGAAVARVIGDA